MTAAVPSGASTGVHEAKGSGGRKEVNVMMVVCVCVVGYVGHGTIWWLWWLLLFMTSKIEFGFEVSRWQCAKTEEYVEAIPGTIPIQLASARCGDMMGDLYMFYVVDTTQLWLRLRIRLSRI